MGVKLTHAGSLQHWDREGNLAAKKLNSGMPLERFQFLLQDNL